MHILVADEQAHHRETLGTALASAGHQVTAVADGWQAWKALEAAARGETPGIDAAFVDWALPRIDGLALWTLLQDAGTLACPLVLMADAGGAGAVRTWSQLLAQGRPPELLVRPFSAALVPEVAASLVQQGPRP
jgi:CheY-like chemotaxis protein